MQLREKGGCRGKLKRWLEYSAFDDIFAGHPSIKTLIDVPSGPGRLFPYWKEKGLIVHGLDYSEEMVAASAEMLETLGLEGSAAHADAFNLAETVKEPADIVVSIRFIYYFNRKRRVQLLKSFASVSNRFVLVQYKVRHTLRRTRRKIANYFEPEIESKDHMRQHFVGRHGILRDVEAAGLELVTIRPLSPLSDRVLVLARKR